MTDIPPVPRATHERWFPVLALVAVATMINYLDRTVLGIAAPYLTKELGLTAASLGIVFSAFSWSYALLQIPGGIFLDRFGTRLEQRFSKPQIEQMMTAAGLIDIRFSDGLPYWVACGRKGSAG